MPLKVVKGAMQCRWISEHDALEHFASYVGKTQSQQHIKPLHWYIACRLVLEGGFRPDEITPHPPLRIEKKRIKKVSGWQLYFDESKATNAESTVLGGLKTKNVDVVVNKQGIGPVIAISCKGTFGAFRNLTNRMEEAVGDCTNLHITYPAMVCGFLSVLRANQAAPGVTVIDDSAEDEAPSDDEPAYEGGEEDAPSPMLVKKTDIAIQPGGTPVEGIVRYHAALRELSGRRGIRDDVSRYEAIGLGLVESNAGSAGTVLASIPQPDSPLRLERFFKAIYERYDERYVYAAPTLQGVTARLEWSETSPVFHDSAHELLLLKMGYASRLAS